MHIGTDRPQKTSAYQDGGHFIGMTDQRGGLVFLKT